MQRCRLLILFALFCTFVAGPAMAHDHDPPRILAVDVMKKMDAGEKIVILDTRTTAAWNAGKRSIPNAIRVANDEVLTRVVRETAKEQLIVTYCT